MDVSLFLAKAFGLYLVIVSIMLLINRKELLKRVNAMLSCPGTMFFSAIVTLILGILLIISHNIWTADWRVIVTLLAWLTFAKGVVRTLYPQIDEKWGDIYQNNAFYYGSGVITLLIGLYLAYVGFLQ